MSNFFFCHYVFKNPSAAEASESVYMRERVNMAVFSRACLISSQTAHPEIQWNKTKFIIASFGMDKIVQLWILTMQNEDFMFVENFRFLWALNKRCILYSYFIWPPNPMWLMLWRIISLRRNYLSYQNMYLNPYPHIGAFWPLCSRWLFENIVTK